LALCALALYSWFDYLGVASDVTSALDIYGHFCSMSFIPTFSGWVTHFTLIEGLSDLMFIVIFGVNDVYDYESDKHNPRKQGSSLQGQVLEPIYHVRTLKAAKISTAIIILSSLYPFWVMDHFITALRIPAFALIILLLSWQYSSLPLRLKERPMLDSLANGAGVWLVWACGFSGHCNVSLRTVFITKKGWALALSASSLHVLGAMADFQSDTAAAQQTIAVFLGQRIAAGFCCLL
jgi:4-hydroxybenzoate polyprenyltransferase